MSKDGALKDIASAPTLKAGEKLDLGIVYNAKG